MRLTSSQFLFLFVYIRKYKINIVIFSSQFSWVVLLITLELNLKKFLPFSRLSVYYTSCFPIKQTTPTKHRYVSPLLISFYPRLNRSLAAVLSRGVTTDRSGALCGGLGSFCRGCTSFVLGDMSQHCNAE